MILALCVAIAGGLGAVARFVLDQVVTRRTRAAYPVGTSVVNLAGSFLLGLVTGLAAGQLLSPSWQVVAGTGFLGGFTTFSAATVEVVRLANSGRRRVAAVHAVGLLFASLAAAGLGWVLGLAF